MMLKCIYRIAQNAGGGKHWRIWRLSIDSPKFSHPNIVNTLKCNGKPTQFTKVLPSNYTSRVISPKFHPANILHYTVYSLTTICIVWIINSYVASYMSFKQNYGHRHNSVFIMVALMYYVASLSV